jgi:predicted nuclease of restriction endonuclease-like (RecB) superfamily
MIQQTINNYAEAIQAIKQAILKSRYNAAVLANREMLMLYYGIGEYISNNSRTGTWGTGAIETISMQLQKELPELRGFSAANLKRMRTFYEAWSGLFINRPMVSDHLNLQYLDAFMRVGFSHHYEIVIHAKSREERLFYIQKCATKFWSYEKLKYNLKSDLYAREGKVANNFAVTFLMPISVAKHSVRSKTSICWITSTSKTLTRPTSASFQTTSCVISRNSS